MFSFLKKDLPSSLSPLKVDIHSHLLPGLDDGVSSFEESLDLIHGLSRLGYKKLITTPHIMTDYYDNSETTINEKLTELKSHIVSSKIDMIIDAAAEYYLDDHLMDKINDTEEKLLTFGDNYLLFETAFMNEPFYLKDFIFRAKSKGFNPVMAHPERYVYLYDKQETITDLFERGLLFQININSLSGYYSKRVKKLAQKLIDNKMVHFLGSDCHNHKHLETLNASMKSKYYARAMELPIRNNSL